MRILVTGGAGFIGSAVTPRLLEQRGAPLLVVDKRTYAGDRRSVRDCEGQHGFQFLEADICDLPRMRAAMAEFRPDAVMHLAAESHVDRSITGAAEAAFRFHHISTDEVFGSLGPTGAFSETTAYDPRSPYSASKASSDHLVRAWHETYGLPVLVTNCSNNYGPYHFPEKLIPLVILNALDGKDLPVYGDGSNIRDWLYVEDHARALVTVVERGRVGETYCIGGPAERRNLVVVETICDVLDQRRPAARPRRELIRFVTHRPGHEQRYALDCHRIERE